MRDRFIQIGGVVGLIMSSLKIIIHVIGTSTIVNDAKDLPENLSGTIGLIRQFPIEWAILAAIFSVACILAPIIVDALNGFGRLLSQPSREHIRMCSKIFIWIQTARHMEGMSFYFAAEKEQQARTLMAELPLILNFLGRKGFALPPVNHTTDGYERIKLYHNYLTAIRPSLAEKDFQTSKQIAESFIQAEA